MNETPDPGPAGTPPPEPTAPRKRPTGSAFFAWLRSLGIVRGGDRWFAGVAGGIAARAGIDPLIVRGLFVVLALLGGPGILLYLLGWLLLPDFAGRLHLEDVVRGRAQAGVLTAAIAIAALVLIPALVSLFTTGIVAVGPALWYTPWMPQWASTTLAWVLAIGLIVVLVLWLRRALRLRSGSAHPTPDAAGSAAHTAHQTAASQPAAGQPGASQASASQPAASAADDPAAPGVSFAQRTEHFAQRVGQQADDWGQRVGETATRWGAEVGAQADAWGTRAAELHESRRLGAGHTVITLALALLAGGLAGAWAISAAPTLSVASGVSAPLIAGLIAALAVLAVSVIVAGVRGRQTGWVGFLSACAVLALLVTVVLPWGSRFQPFGEMHVAAGSTPGAVMVAGKSEIDLRDARPEDRDLVVWQLAGRTEVILPDHAPTVLTLRLFAGQITESWSGEREAAGPLLSRTITANLPAGVSDAAAQSATHVTVNLFAGQISVDGNPLGPLEPDDSERTGSERTGSEAPDGERAAQLQEELDRIQWQLDRPGLHEREAAGLQRAHDAVSARLQQLELEDTP